METELIIRTKKPRKWVAVDLETNELWVWDERRGAMWARAPRRTVVEVGKLTLEALE